MNVAELLTVETSILRTLCLSVASSRESELRSCIVENLSEDDFYFPITKSIYSAVSELSANGTPVDAQSLQEVLIRRSVDSPDDFFLEDLFAGDAPTARMLLGWISELKALDDGPVPVDETMEPPSSSFEKTHPSLRAPLPVAGGAVEPRASASDADPESTVAAPEVPSDQAHASAPPRADAPTLSPESAEWLGYLAELSKKQGELLKTGFAGLDRGWGGLGPGLVLLAGEDPRRLLDFLKQLVDQIAIHCRVPCVYLSFERSKNALRLQTLARLSGASAVHIRDGRFDRDSAEWRGVIRAGERAVEWLRRIYVLEPSPGLTVWGIRRLREELIGSGAGASCLIAIDNLERLATNDDLLQSVAELKELAESLGIVVVGAASSVELVHEKSADMAITFSEDGGATVLEVSTPGTTEPRRLRFAYRSEIHRFEES